MRSNVPMTTDDSVESTDRVHILVGLVVFALVFSGCGWIEGGRTNDVPQDHRTPSSMTTPGCPVNVVILQDISGSIDSTRTPVLEMRHLEPLFCVLLRTGGQIAVTFIDESSNDLSVRLVIDPPPVRQAGEGLDSDRFTNQEKELRNRAAEAAHQKQTEDWRARQLSRIATFRTSLEPMLSSRKRARRSAVYQGIARAAIILGERSVSSCPPRKTLVLVSDGDDNAGAAVPPTTFEGELLVVNGRPKMAAFLTALKPLRFEAIEPALAFIHNSLTPNRKECTHHE